MNSQTFVALGSNQNWASEQPEMTVLAALGALSTESVSLSATSRLFRSPAFPAGSGPEYVNAVVRVKTGLPPADLLAHLHAVEAHFGRVRAARWGSRTLDLDLIAAGDLILPDAAHLRHWMDLSPDLQRTEAPTQLILPHPRLQDRAFVLMPMADIAPAWRHPMTGRSVTEMLDALPEATKAEVRPL
ncbi:MAG TPA: 2-amino-4-hydroxy-6-hydroxymethyldihydropteridine diphosphokinase [Paracoccaceae bacterium]|nr:2-amino-4-hydroxy-6-hydroxymethyldihydropteridine diphosphokinase [Paracoccaceae bacterium]